PGRLIAGVAGYAGHLVRLERENAIDRIIVRDLTGVEHAIAFDEAAYALSLDSGLEYDTTITRFVYQSTTTWRAGRARWARPRRSPPATIRPPTRRGGFMRRRPTAPTCRSPC